MSKTDSPDQVADILKIIASMKVGDRKRLIKALVEKYLEFTVTP